MPKVNPQKPPMPNKATSGSIKSKGGVLDRIAPIGFDEDEGIKIMTYGKSGTGKTTLWATFPGPILAIICSGGKKTGELRSINTPEYREKIQSVVLESVQEIPEILDYVRETKVKTLVLDHVSGLQDLVLKETLGLDEIPAQKSWGLATQQQYGQCAMKTKEALRAMLDLSINVVIVGQERTDNEGSQGDEILTPYVGVDVIPSLARWLNPAVDYNCQTYIAPKMEAVTTTIGKKNITTYRRGKGVEYRLRVEPHDVFTTKFRVPKGTLEVDYIVNPTYQKIMALINGEKLSEIEE